MSHFFCTTVQKVSRHVIDGGLNVATLKEEQMILTIHLTSNGNTSKIPDGQVFNSVMNKLNKIK